MPYKVAIPVFFPPFFFIIIVFVFLFFFDYPPWRSCTLIEILFKIVLIRHGESQWNKENKFTGWYDVGLSEKVIPPKTTATRF